jgi:hypothetical protein
MKVLSLTIQKILKSKSNCKVRKSKIIPVERFCHMEYINPITYHSKDMANVKVFEKWVKLQG